ncbi:MAG: adenosylcobinamide-GDP ribazoletransferase [Roseovarius sp.]
MNEKSDATPTGPLLAPGDLITALGLLSRLPLPVIDGTRAAQAAWAYPLAGCVLGVLAAILGALITGLGLPPAIVALVVLAAMVMLTGAMHEDGLADTADGLWGGWDRGARLEIMRDSRIGTYGVIALMLSLAARWLALWMLFEAGLWAATAGLIASAALSRATMPVVMYALPHARTDGLSHRVGRVAGATAGVGIGIGVMAALICLGVGAIPAACAAVVAASTVAMIAKRKIGGQTGDILGASQQLCEIAVLFALVT